MSKDLFDFKKIIKNLTDIHDKIKLIIKKNKPR